MPTFSGFLKSAKPIQQQDYQTGAMIGVLMCCAKTLELAKKNIANPDTDAGGAASAKDYRNLIISLHKLFPKGDLEQQVIEFARGLGFEIEQKYVTPGSGVKQ
jgi:hypothetical protein